MKNLKKTRWMERNGVLQTFLFPLLVFVFTLVCAGVSVCYFQKSSNLQSIDLLRQSARRAVVQCYAIEGCYPENVEYLEQEYGLHYNHDKYFIDYQAFASNVMPNVEVYEKK